MTGAARDKRRKRVLLPLPGKPETTTNACAGYLNTTETLSTPRRSTTPRGRKTGPRSAMADSPASVAAVDTELPTT